MLALVVMSYVIFAMGEVSGMSGIVATVFSSILLGVYARPLLSAKGSILGSFFLAQLAKAMDTMIFLLVGLCAVSIDHKAKYFSGVCMVACLLGRAAAVIPVGLVSNMMKWGIGRARGVPPEDWHLISPGSMFMIWHAGLRGAICLTLCLQLGSWVDKLEGPGTRTTLQTGTCLLIVVFLFVFGGSTEFLLKYLGITIGEEHAVDTLYKTEFPSVMQRGLQLIDDYLMIPVFVGEIAEEESLKHVEVEEVMRLTSKGHYL
jgi:NhaP-type Na+/H+ or K+/H+ antiporter